jgi:hypothetical protein
MKATLTNAEIVNLYNSLENLDMQGSAKFTYTISKNRALLKPQVDALQEVQKSFHERTPQLKEYQTRAEELVKKYSTHEDGTPNMQDVGNGNFQRVVLREKHKEFFADRTALDVEFADLLKTAENHQQDVNNLMREKVEVELRMLPFAELPKGSVGTRAMNSIFVFVQDPDDVTEPAPKNGPDTGKVVPIK